MASDQQFSLRWNNYQTHIVSAFESLRDEEDFVDVTLGCEGRKLRGHKMLLSACSPYFRELLKDNPCQHPIIILKDVRFADLQALVEFMYNGQVNVSQDQLSSFLRTAEVLKIRGLADGDEKDKKSGGSEPAPQPSREAEMSQMSGENNVLPVIGSDLHGHESPPPKRKKHQSRCIGSQSPSSLNAPSQPPPPPPPLPPPVEVETTPEVIPVDMKVEVPDYESHDDTQDTGYDVGGGGSSEDMSESVQESLDNRQDDGSYSSSMQVPVSFEGTSNQSVPVMPKPGPSTLQDPGQDPSQAEDIMEDVRTLEYDPNQDMTFQLSHLKEDFSPGSGLDGHHKQTYPTVCTICGKEFKHYGSLSAHKRAHTGHTRCPICHRVMSRMNVVRSHMKRVHGSSLEKPA